MFLHILSTALLLGSVPSPPRAVPPQGASTVGVAVAGRARAQGPGQVPSGPRPGPFGVRRGSSFLQGGSVTTILTGPGLPFGVLPFGLLRVFLVNTQTGIPERFLLFSPDIPPDQPAPLLVGFHSFSVSEDDLLLNTSFFNEAAARGWYMLAPLGLIDINWGFVGAQSNVEDAVTWVLDHAAIDPERVYGVGFSMGAGWCASYAARHLDPGPTHVMFSSIVQHTGGLSLANTWTLDPSARLSLEFILGGDPFGSPFQYSQVSTIDLAPVTGTIDPLTDMARNLTHVAVRTFYAVEDPLAYLRVQSAAFHQHLTSLGGTTSLVTDPTPGQSHTWSSLDETQTCDFFAAQPPLTIPASGRTLADRDGTFFYFDIVQDAAQEFTPFVWAIDSELNRVDLRETENLARVTIDTATAPLDVALFLRVGIQSFDGSTDDIALSGYAVTPTQVRLDNQVVDQVAPQGAGGWWYDAAEELVFLPGSLIANGAEFHEWAISPITASPGSSSVVVSAASGVVADGVATSTVTVTLRDSQGEFICGELVQLASDGTGHTFLPPAGPTDTSGRFVATLASTVAELKTLTATAGAYGAPIVLDDHPTVEFVGDPDGVSAALSTAGADPALGVIADGVAVSVLTVTVLDGLGNPVQGVTVLVASDDVLDTITGPAGPTDGGGEVTATVASTRSGTKTITVTVDPGGAAVVLDARPTIEFVADAGNVSPSLSTATADPAAGVPANSVATSTVTVTVVDANGNPVAGVDVEVTSDGTGNTIVGPLAPTDAAGMATATIATIFGVLKTLTVTVDPLGAAVVLDAHPTVDFASVISAVLSAADAVPSAGLVADGLAASTVTITVRDFLGSPLAGQTVELAASGAGNVLVQPSGPTDALGRTTATLASTIAESKTLTVTVDPGGAAVELLAHPEVTFDADPDTVSASLSTALASPALGVLAGGVELSTITVTVADANGNPIAGKVVAIAATGSGNSIVQAPGPTDSAGQAVATIASTMVELKTLTVTVDPGGVPVVLDAQPTVDFVFDISPSLSTVTANPATGVVADGIESATITVTVRDALGSPLQGQMVEVSAGGAGVVGQPLSPTDANGVATATVASTVAGLEAISATVNPAGSPVALDAQPTVEFIADVDSVSASLSSAGADPAIGVVADGVQESTITITVRDAHGNPVPGRTVELASNGSNDTIGQPPGPTGADGIALATLSSTTAELKTLTVTVDPLGSPVVLDDIPTVDFVPDISASLSSAVAVPVSDVVADGVELATITVTVLDAGGSPAPGQVVALASDGAGDVLTQPVGLTDGSGQATGTLASTQAGLVTLTVTVNPNATAVELDDQPTVTFVADADDVSAAFSTAIALPASDVVADGLAVATITVTVVDANQNPIEGKTVALASDGSDNSITQPAGPTDAAGVVTATIASTSAELKTITVTVDPAGVPVVLDEHPLVAFIGDAANPSASLSSVSADPGTGIVADGAAVATITITVRDVNGNVVPDVEVAVASDGSGDTLSQPGGPTDALGTATATIAATTAELKTLTATVDPPGLALLLLDQPTVLFVADASNVSASLSSAVAVPDLGVLADGVESSTVTVIVRDANGNPVPGQTVEIASDGAGNIITQPAEATDASGATTASIASTSAELKTITVTVEPLGDPTVLGAQPTVEFVPDAGTIDASLSGLVVDATFGTVADGVDLVTVTITVRDAFGNPVSGQTVAVAATGVANALTQPASATDANGATTATLASAAAEPKSFSARVNPGASQVQITQTAEAVFVWPTSGAYFVRTTGSDASSGTSPRAAWASLGHAASMVVPGDTVWVGGGTYVENVVLDRPGTPSAPIVFAADRGGGHTGDAGKVILDGSGGLFTLQVAGASHVVIDGFTIIGAFPGFAPGGGIDLACNPTTGVLLRNNEVYGNGRGIDVLGADELVIENNRISKNVGAVGGDGLRIRSSNGVDVRQNMIYANAGHGMRVTSGSRNVLVSDNTIYSNFGDGVHVIGLETSVELHSNILSFGVSNGIHVLAPATATSHHNIAWGHVGQDWNGLAPGVGDFSLDPQFVDPLGPDANLGGVGGDDDGFQLELASPAFDAGFLTAASVVLTDGTTLRVHTSRVDGVLDGSAPDGPTVNLGFHFPALTGDLAVLELGDGRLVYGVGVDSQVVTRGWDDSAGVLSSGTKAPPAEATVRWAEHRVSPLANAEEVTVELSDSGVLSVLDWDGATWSTGWVSTGIPAPDSDKRLFDVEFTASGRVLVVYSDDTAVPKYRVRVGGAWSLERALPVNDGAGPFPDLTAGGVRWVELVPRLGTDEIALLYSDTASDLGTIVWNGNDWDTSTAATLELDLKRNVTSNQVHNRVFDGAFESLSGQLVAAWGRQTTDGYWYATKPVGGPWSAAAHVSGAPPDSAHFIDLAAEPGSDRIAGGFFDLGGVESLGLATWDGSAWVDAGQYDPQIWNVNSLALGEFQGAVGWIGTTGQAVCVYSDDQQGTIDWASWTAGGGWAIQPDVIVPGMSFLESVELARIPGRDALMAVIQAAGGELYVATYDGSLWTVIGGGAPLATSLSSESTKPFSVSFK